MDITKRVFPVFRNGLRRKVGPRYRAIRFDNRTRAWSLHGNHQEFLWTIGRKDLVLNKMYQCLVAGRMPLGCRKLLFVGPEESGMYPWAAMLRRVIDPAITAGHSRI